MLEWLIGPTPGSLRNREVPPLSMTDDALIAWSNMGLNRKTQLERLAAWANMLERRVAELDPDYRAYQFGRVDNKAKGES